MREGANIYKKGIESTSREGVLNRDARARVCMCVHVHEAEGQRNEQRYTSRVLIDSYYQLKFNYRRN